MREQASQESRRDALSSGTCGPLESLLVSWPPVQTLSAVFCTHRVSGRWQILPGWDASATKTLDQHAGALHARAAEVTHAHLDELTEKIIACAIEVHRILGPGLLESVYRECMIIEMTREHLRVVSERHVPLVYKGHRIGSPLKLDLLVNDCVVVEVKAVERLHPIHLAQGITYLKLTGYPAGLVMNFNEPTLKAGLRRLDHPDRYVKKI